MISGIYYIKNIQNNKIYIGSSIDIEHRISDHFRALKANKHDNIYLQNSYNKYGKNNFCYGIIEIVEDKDNLLDREQYYINIHYDGGVQCYNMNPSATVPPIKTKKCALYNLNGEFIKIFNTINECARFLNKKPNSISTAIKFNRICSKKYYIRYADDIIEETIQVNETQPNSFIELDDDYKIIKKFNTIKELHNDLNITTNNDITSLYKCINKFYKYRTRLFIKESSYEQFLTIQNEKATQKRLQYKYILEFDVYGDLQSVTNNCYGATKRELEDIFKFNNNNYYKRLDNKYLLYNERIYLKSNTVIKKIKTNITIYAIEDLYNNVVLKSNKKSDLLSYLKISRGTYDYYCSRSKIYNNMYIFKKTTY